MTLLFSSVLHLFFCCWKYTESSIFFWKNYLVNEFRTAMDGGLLGISKKIVSIFKTWQKMETKFGQFKKLKCPNFVNCPNFVTIFCRVLKMKIIFLDIPSNPPPIAVRNSLTNQFFQKNWRFCIFSTTKKVQNWREEKGPGTSLAIPRPLRSGIHWPIFFFFKKIDLSVFFQKKKKMQNWREE